MAEEVPLQPQQQQSGYVGRDNSGSNDVCSSFLVGLSYILIALTFPISVFFCIKVIW